MTADSPQGDCLTDHELWSFLDPDQSTDSTRESHVESCPSCQSRLDTLLQPPALDDYHAIARSTWHRGDTSADGQLAWAPTTFDRFQIESLLGRGGMGNVYRAWDKELERAVAIKLLLRRHDSSSLARFRREARSLSKLNHPHIVPVLTTGSTDVGTPYIVMPLVEGRSLKERLLATTLHPRDAAELIRQVAEGLRAAHEKGFVHRDVKPANILLDVGDQHALLSDFGLVRGVSDETLTETEIICGTPEYMSPEQGSNIEQANALSDIYSLGITLYECLTGSVPFRGRPLDVISHHRELEPTPPSRLSQGIPKDLETICLCAVRKEPKQRYQTAEAFANDLQRFLDGKPISARPTSSGERLWKWSKRNRSLTTSLVILFATLMTATVVTTVLWQQSRENARVAEQRSNDLMASQQVMRANIDTLRDSFQATFKDVTQDRSTFVLLPTSVRNTTLISMYQSSQLLFETSRNDPKTLRELTDELSAAASFALSNLMELRATELARLSCEVVDRLLEIEPDSALRDLLRAARANNLFGEAQAGLISLGNKDPALLQQALESFDASQRFCDAAGGPTFDLLSEDFTNEARIQLFRSQRGTILLDSSIDTEQRITLLVDLLDSLNSIEPREHIRNAWLLLEEQLLSDLASLAPPAERIEYLNQRTACLFALSQWELEHNGKNDPWTLRNAGQNQFLIGKHYETESEVETAQQHYQNAAGQFQGLCELYATSGHYRISWFSVLETMADLEWGSGSRESAWSTYHQALKQIELLALLNPRDEGVFRRAAMLLGKIGDHRLEVDDPYAAGESYAEAAEYALRNSTNPFRMNPNDTGYREFCVELLTKAVAAYERSGHSIEAEQTRLKLRRLTSSPGSASPLKARD